MNDFVILAKLGEGSYSNVYKVKRVTDGKEYAMKKVLIKRLECKSYLKRRKKIL